MFSQFIFMKSLLLLLLLFYMLCSQ